MVTKDPKVWFERGRQEARSISWHGKQTTIQKYVQHTIKHSVTQYPQLQHLDFPKTLEQLNEERLESEPDPQRYPELQGLQECYRERQRGFMETAPCSRAEMAVFYNWYWHETHRLHTRYAGRDAADTSDGCTVVYFRDSAEGPLLGRNNDFAFNHVGIPQMPDWNGLIHSPIASVALCDEEPTEIFPADPFELMSDEIKADIHRVVEFLERYNEFWGPCNTVVIDTNRNAVAIEKLNCRMGVTWPQDGVSYVTSFAYQDPALLACKMACDRKYMKRIGITEDSPDWAFWRGNDRRLDRLAALVDQESRKGPTLWGLGGIMTDHGAPFPDRICLAGEPTGTGLWTVASFSCVLQGPSRRMLYWRVEDGQPAYARPPYLISGDGIEPRDDWRQGTRPLPAGEGFSDTVINIQCFE
ncbi:hypothetical protein HQ590_04695 [bacterium]|nr:hypothetical protein [bacterium]